MSVRFKFRSAAGFDAVDLRGRASISVRDLRARIVDQKNLNLCKDFDLVVSDADTGAAYEDEEFVIPAGSSVVIRRVPGVPKVNSAANRLDELVHSPSQNVDVVNFDDFGNDLYNIESSTLNSSAGPGNANPADFELEFGLRFQNGQGSDLSEAMSRGHADKSNGIPSYTYENKNKIVWPFEGDEHLLDSKQEACCQINVNSELPVELKCSLCNKIFKDAVMIPCCQRSFCNSCIRLALIEKASCPKCSSRKCRVDDLLPNLSLRQAIEHFPETQMPVSGSDKIIPRYAPDGESGIHAREISCAISVHQREPLLPDSPTATGRGSNLVLAESACESLVNNRGVTSGMGSQIMNPNTEKSLKPEQRVNQAPAGNENITSKVLTCTGDPLGDRTVKAAKMLPPKDEVDPVSKKRKGLFAATMDKGSLAHTSRYRKGERNCYTCGSPDHLFRDCPTAAANPYSMVHTRDAMFTGGGMAAYGQYNWGPNSFPALGQHPPLYGASAVLPFDPRMVPSYMPPFAIPSYVPALYSGLPSNWTPSAAPVIMPGVECPPTQAEVLDLQDRERKLQCMTEHDRERRSFDDDFNEDHYKEFPRRSTDSDIGADSDTSRSYSGSRLRRNCSRARNSRSPFPNRVAVCPDERTPSTNNKYDEGSRFSTQKAPKKHYHSDKRDIDFHGSSIKFKYHSKEKNNHGSDNKPKKHNEGGHGSDTSDRINHHKHQKESLDENGKAGSHKTKREHMSHRQTNSDSSSRHQKEKRSSQSSRHCKRIDVNKGDHVSGERWEMIGPPHYSSEEEHYSKRRRQRQ